MSRSFGVFSLLCGIFALLSCAPVRSGDAKGGQTFKLQSAANVFLGRTVDLAIELDGKGGGTGVLFGGHPVDLKLVKDDNAEKKGRQLYEITGQKLVKRFLLVIPTKPDSPCWLVISPRRGAVDERGEVDERVEDIILMERK